MTEPTKVMTAAAGDTSYDQYRTAGWTDEQLVEHGMMEPRATGHDTATDLPRLMQCIGSRLMPSPIPDSGSKEQRDEGTAAHWLAERMFHGAPAHAGITAPNGYVITDDMVEHVSQYVSALDCGEMEAETTWSGQGFEVRGRADHLVYRERVVEPVHVYDIHHPSILTIDDFKYGWGIVSPVENWTLLSHAIAWVIRNGVTPDRIVLRIHQPRPYHPDGPLREWSCDYEELMGYHHRIATRLSNADDTLQTGPACAKCPARFDCRTLDAAVYNAIDVMGVPFDDTLPKSVITEQHALFERAEQMIKIGMEAREELISHRIKHGEVFEGYSLERRYGQRRWKTGLTGKALSLASGVDLVEDAVVTPAEAIRRGVPKEAVEALVDRPMLDPKLKRIDADAKARAVFGEPE